jgi:hypothetical protein
MKTSSPQISQIAQAVKRTDARPVFKGNKGYQGDAHQQSIQGLCNLRSLRIKSVQE